MTQLHSRFMLTQSASSEYGLFWFRMLERQAVNSYQVEFDIWSQIDRFWIDSARNELSTVDACAAWKALDKASLGEAVREAGDELVRIALESQLSYGEIWSTLMNVRNTSCKYLLRAERHPEDPDQPSGLA